MEPISLIPIRDSEAAVGQALPQAVFDWHGNCLFAVGHIVASKNQLEEILIGGFFQDGSWGPGTSDPDAPGNTLKKPVLDIAAAKEKVKPQEVVVAMEEIHWYVGETLYLQLHDDPLVRYTVYLIGFVKNKSIFISAPTVDGKFALIRDGQTFIVRAFSGKNAYAFTASALKSVHSPHPYVHLSYPQQVRCSIVRQSARVDVKLIAAISVGEPERISAGTIIDLSMGGASAMLKAPLGTKGEMGRIKFKVKAVDQDAFLNLKIVLRHVAPPENGEGYKHGFEFVEVPVHERLILSAFVHQTMVESS